MKASVTLLALLLSASAATAQVGIGTIAPNPVTNLDIVGDTVGIRNPGAGWDNLWFTVNGSTANIIASGADGGLNLRVGSNTTGSYGDGQTLPNTMTLLPSGNVGIGTTAPNAKLDVAGTTETDALRITTGGGVKDFAVKNDAAGNVGFRKGFRGVGLRYIIATQGCFPSRGDGNAAALTCGGDAMIGEIKLWTSPGPLPNGWAECNGQLLPIAQPFYALFSLIGVTYGGNGQSTFAVPDLRGGVPVGVGANGTNTWGEGEQN